MIKEYLKFHGMDSALDMFQSEERTKYYNNKGSKSHQLNIVPQVSPTLPNSKQDMEQLPKFPKLY